MTPAQEALWRELCDPLTTDEPLRLKMLDAAIRVKHEHLKDTLAAVGLSEESIRAVEEAMETHRTKVLVDAVK